MLEFILFVYELITFHNIDKVYDAANKGEWYMAGAGFCISLFYLISFISALWAFIFGPAGEFLFDTRSSLPFSITGCSGGISGEPGECVVGSLFALVIVPIILTAIWPVIAIVTIVILVIVTILLPLRELIRLIRRTNHASGET